MSEDDLKSVIASYQTKAFELFNTNIVIETQYNTLRKNFDALTAEVTRLREENQSLGQALQEARIASQQEAQVKKSSRAKSTQDDF